VRVFFNYPITNFGNYQSMLPLPLDCLRISSDDQPAMTNLNNFFQRFLAGAALAFMMPTLSDAQAVVAPMPAPVEMCLTGMTMGKPPLKYLSFRVSVHNHALHPRWFLFPAALYEQAQAPLKEEGVNSAEVYSSPFGREIKIIHFHGSIRLQPESAGGFKAVLLPAQAKVSLDGFRIRYWGGQLRSELPLKVLAVDEVFINSIPAARWIHTDPTTYASGPKNENEFHADASRFNRQYIELPVALRGTEEIVIEHALTTKCASANE
jgi:hypothetical protein